MACCLQVCSPLLCTRTAPGVGHLRVAALYTHISFISPPIYIKSSPLSSADRLYCQTLFSSFLSQPVSATLEKLSYNPSASCSGAVQPSLIRALRDHENHPRAHKRKGPTTRCGMSRKNSNVQGTSERPCSSANGEDRTASVTVPTSRSHHPILDNIDLVLVQSAVLVQRQHKARMEESTTAGARGVAIVPNLWKNPRDLERHLFGRTLVLAEHVAHVKSKYVVHSTKQARS